MKNTKLILHICPWEIDHYLLVVDKLKQSSYYIEDQLYIDTALNLSDGIINWETSKLSKEYFIEKYNTINNILKDKFIHKPFIYEGGKVYGHLNLQRDAIQKNIDYYITICPDISFTETTLVQLIEAAKQIKNKYFIVTPEIFKSWDESWDSLVNKTFENVPYTECIEHDIHKIHDQVLHLNNDVKIEKLNGFKFAGWFDLFNKETYEKAFKMPDSWNGYGPWDLYALNLSYFLRQNKVDIQQYVIKNQVIWFYDTGNLSNKEEYGTDGQLKLSIKKFLDIKKDRNSQRVDIQSNIGTYMNEWIEYAKKEGIYG